MRKVTILSGVPGVGKSAFASKNFPFATVCSASHYFHGLPQGYDAHTQCLMKYANLIVDGKGPQVLVDNTNATTREITTYADLATAHGYSLRIITLECDLELAARFNKQGLSLEKIRAYHSEIQKRVLCDDWPHEVIRVIPGP